MPVRRSLAFAKRAILARAGPRFRGLVELSTISDRLSKIERTLEGLEYFSNGSRATYVGDNRVLVRIVVAGANIAYFVEANDRLLTPWFVATGRYEM